MAQLKDLLVQGPARVIGTTTSNGYRHSSVNDDSYVLKAGGGYKLESNLSVGYAASAGSATDSTKVAKSGDTMTGTLYVIEITGSGTSDRINIRHIDGQNCGGDYSLYLNYHTGANVYFGGGTYGINSSGYFNGSASYASSAGNADTVDGYHYNNLPYVPYAQVSVEQNTDQYTFARNNALERGSSFVYNTNSSEWAYLSGMSSSGSYGCVFKFGYTGPTAYLMGYSGGNWGNWREFAFLDSNVASASSASYATYAGYIEGTNDAANPGGALLRSGSGRADASPSGDTWIYYDTLGGTSSPWGIRHDQGANNIGFFGAGSETSYICLSDGKYYNYGLYHLSYGSSGYVFTTDGGVQHIGSMSVNYASSAGNADTVDNEHASAFAHVGQWNNLLCAGNEFNFISNGFSGDVWLNYQDGNRQNGGNVTSYYFGNGAGNWTPALYCGGVHVYGYNSSAYVLTSDGSVSAVSGLSVNYANSAGSAPASDVYSWAKQSSKPSYNLDEIGNRYDSLLYFSSAAPNYVGSVSAIGMAISPEHGANRLAFLNPAAMEFEYSTDGSNFGALSVDNGTKTNLVTQGGAVPVGRANGSDEYYVGSKMRLTFTCLTADGTTYLYCSPKKMMINISSSGGMTVLVETRTGTSLRSGGGWDYYGTYSLSGWSGWNEIPLVLGTLGGGNGQWDNNAQMRLTFEMTSKSSDYPTTAYINSIRIFADNIWSSPSNMAYNNHIYSFDSAQNAFFPAKVYVGTSSGGEVLNVGGWVGTVGSSGWYNITHGGGWYQSDSSWIRSYSGCGVVAGGYYHSSYGDNAYVLTAGGGATTISSLSVASAAYPIGFTSRQTSDWSGVSGTLATDWSVNGADIMFKYDGDKLNVITDGYFYQGIDIYGSSKRVLDEYDLANTTWTYASYATSAGSVAWGNISSNPYSGTTFVSGNSSNGTHDCDSAWENGHYYYWSNGPSTSIGASTGDGALYVQNYSSDWVGQIAQDYRNGRLFIRGKSNGTWQSWMTVIDSGNISSYAITSHQSVVNGGNTASWGSSVTVGTVGGTALTFTMPSNPDTWRPITNSYSDTSSSTSLSQYGGYLLDHAKMGKLTVVNQSASSGLSILDTDDLKYYVFSGTVNTLDFTLPVIAESTGTMQHEVMLYFTTGASPNINVLGHSSGGVTNAIKFYSNFKIEANKTYEIHALFNGVAWILACAEVVSTMP